MANRPELQNKGQGRHKDQNGHSAGPGTSHTGMSRVIRENKRIEAEARNALTVPERRRAYRTPVGKLLTAIYRKPLPVSQPL